MSGLEVAELSGFRGLAFRVEGLSFKKAEVSLTPLVP